MPLRDVIGHSGLTRLMARLIGRGRLPHAVLLEGIPGCGRRTVALAIAQSLLCSEPLAGDACGACAACRLVVEGSHPDLVCLPHDTQGDELSVEVVRTTIAEAVYQSPLIGACRVFFLPGIERLHPSASNTLLKVLEEPPAGTYMVMTTANAGSVLRTIRSRSQLHRMSPLTSADLELLLLQIGLTPAEARARAALGGGGHRGCLQGDVQPPLEQMLALCRDGLNPEIVIDVISSLPQSARDDGAMTVAAEQRRVLGIWLRALLDELRRGLRGPDAAGNADAIERVMALQRDVRLNISPHLVIEGLSLGAR